MKPWAGAEGSKRCGQHLDAYEVFLIKILFHACCADNVEHSDRSRSARVLHDEGAEASWNYSMIVVALEMRIKKAVWPVHEQHRRRPQHHPAHTKSHSLHTLTRLQAHVVVMLQVTHTAARGKILKLKFTGSSHTRKPPKSKANRLRIQQCIQLESIFTSLVKYSYVH